MHGTSRMLSRPGAASVDQMQEKGYGNRQLDRLGDFQM
jgi:hypothetical protein